MTAAHLRVHRGCTHTRVGCTIVATSCGVRPGAVRPSRRTTRRGDDHGHSLTISLAASCRRLGLLRAFCGPRGPRFARLRFRRAGGRCATATRAIRARRGLNRSRLSPRSSSLVRSIGRRVRRPSNRLARFGQSNAVLFPRLSWRLWSCVHVVSTRACRRSGGRGGRGARGARLRSPAAPSKPPGRLAREPSMTAAVSIHLVRCRRETHGHRGRRAGSPQMRSRRRRPGLQPYAACRYRNPPLRAGADGWCWPQANDPLLSVSANAEHPITCAP